MKKLEMKKFTKKFIHAVKNIGSDSDKDWRILFLTFLLVLVITTAEHLKTYFSVENDKRSGASLEAKGVELINSKALSNLLTKYEQRTLEYSEVASSTPLVDPAR